MARTRWRHSVGSRPNKVTVYERTPGGPLYIQIWNPALRDGQGDWIRRSLRHRDRTRAKAFAAEQYAKLVKGTSDLESGRITLGRILSLYLTHRTPRKTNREQRADRRRAEMWSRFLGGRTPAMDLSLRSWEAFIDARATGRIDARGKPVPEAENRRPVRTRTVEADLKWLKWTLNWAVKWRQEGHYLLQENPVRGFEIPTEKNPRRATATKDRYEALRAVSDQVQMEVSWDGRRRYVPSHLTGILTLAEGTGRRISAILKLRYSDLRLERGEHTPHGAIRWPASTDKQGKASTVPISAEVRRAIERVRAARPGIGDAPLFPAPTDRSQPVSRYLADKWLREAEKLADLQPQKGALWHAFRRKWATERKHLPAKDVARAGGWSSVETVQRIYQQADEETMLRVIQEAGELRAKTQS